MPKKWPLRGAAPKKSKKNGGRVKRNSEIKSGKIVWRGGHPPKNSFGGALSD